MKYLFIFFITLLLIGCESTNESSSNGATVIDEKTIETVVEPTASTSPMPTEMTEKVMTDMKKELEQLDMPEEEKTAFIKKVEKNIKKRAKPPVAKTKKPTKVAKPKEVLKKATNAKPKEVKKAEEVIVKKVKPKATIDSSPRNFVNKEYSVKGNWSIQEEGGKTYVKLHSNFNTKKKFFYITVLSKRLLVKM